MAVAMLLMMPPPNAIAPGSAPPNAPQPGTPGGGGLPTNLANPSLPLALSLVPAGLAAVAVFPPFATPRTFNATAVIFSENPGRKKRDVYEASSNSIYAYDNHYNTYDYYDKGSYNYYERPSIFLRMWDTLVSSKKH